MSEKPKSPDFDPDATIEFDSKELLIDPKKTLELGSEDVVKAIAEAEAQRKANQAAAADSKDADD